MHVIIIEKILNNVLCMFKKVRFLFKRLFDYSSRLCFLLTVFKLQHLL